MPDTKVEDEVQVGALTGAEFVYCVQAGAPRKFATGQMATLARVPPTSDGAALGSPSLQWSDLYLASGGIIDWGGGNYTLSHSPGILTFSGNLTSPGTMSAGTIIGVTQGLFGSIASAAGAILEVRKSAAIVDIGMYQDGIAQWGIGMSPGNALLRVCAGGRPGTGNDVMTLNTAGLMNLPGGQIQFPAAQNASAGPNTLDDYEEGTWTPSLGGTAVYTDFYGRYTKVGRSVELVGFVSVATIGTGSPNSIGSLPFAPVAAPSAGYVSYWNGLAAASVSVVGMVTGGSFVVGSAVAASVSVTWPANLFQNASAMYFGSNYPV